MFSLSQKFLFSSFLRKQESSFFWIPGRVSLARNDNPTFPKMSNARSPPAEPGVYLTAIMEELASDCINKGVDIMSEMTYIKIE